MQSRLGDGEFKRNCWFFSGFDVFLKAYTSVILREEALDVCIFASFGRIVLPYMEG